MPEIPPENRDATNTVAVRLTPKQWQAVAELWTVHQPYGAGPAFVADQLYAGAGLDPNQVAEEFAQGQIAGEAVNADGTAK